MADEQAAMWLWGEGGVKDKTILYPEEDGDRFTWVLRNNLAVRRCAPFSVECVQNLSKDRGPTASQGMHDPHQLHLHCSPWTVKSVGHRGACSGLLLPSSAGPACRRMQTVIVNLQGHADAWLRPARVLSSPLTPGSRETSSNSSTRASQQ